MADYYQGNGGKKTRLAPLATVFLIATVIPAYTYVGTTFLTPARIVLLVSLPFLLVRLFSGALGKIVLTDVLVLLMISWMSFAMFVMTPRFAVSWSGIQWPSTVGAYLVARASIRSPDDFRAFARLFGIILAVLLPLAAIESLTSDPVLPSLFTMIPNVVSIEDVNYPPRLGLDRAQVAFSHPIHFGFYASVYVGMAYVAFYGVLNRGKRMLLVGLSLANCFFSLSSGPLLGAILQCGLIFYGYFTFKMDNQWKLLLIGIAAVYIVLELASPYPALYEISKRIALNSSTASYRSLIFEYGTAQVAQTPIFGVGKNGWARPFWMQATIDNHWLLLAVQSGMPAFLLLLGAFLNSLWRAGGGKFRKGSDLYFIRLSWNIVLIGAMLTMSTVALFGEITGVVFFILGAGQFLFTAEEPALDQEGAKEKSVRRRALFGDLEGDNAGAPVMDTKKPDEAELGRRRGRRALLS